MTALLSTHPLLSKKGDVMATLTIRNIDDETKRLLRELHGIANPGAKP